MKVINKPMTPGSMFIEGRYFVGNHYSTLDIVVESVVVVDQVIMIETLRLAPNVPFFNKKLFLYPSPQSESYNDLDTFEVLRIEN